MYDINICNVLSNEAYHNMIISEEGVIGDIRNKILELLKLIFKRMTNQLSLLELYQLYLKKNKVKVKKVLKKMESIPQNLRSEFKVDINEKDKYSLTDTMMNTNYAKAYLNEEGITKIYGALERLYRGIQTDGRLTDSKVFEAYTHFTSDNAKRVFMGASFVKQMGGFGSDYDNIYKSLHYFDYAGTHRIRKPFIDYDIMLKLSKDQKYHEGLSKQSKYQLQEIYKILNEWHEKTKKAIKYSHKGWWWFFNKVEKECDRLLKIKNSNNTTENVNYILDDFLIDSSNYISYESIDEEGFEGLREIFTKFFRKLPKPKKEPLSEEQRNKMDTILKSKELEDFIKNGLNSIQNKYPKFFKINPDALIYYKDDNGIPNISYDAWKIKDIKTGKGNIARTMMQYDEYKETGEMWMSIQNDAVQLFKDAVDKFLSEFKEYITGDYLGDWDDGDIGFNGIESEEEIIEFNEEGFEGIKDTIIDGVKDSANLIIKAGKHAKNYIKDINESKKERNRIRKLIESILMSDAIISELVQENLISVRVENKDSEGKYPVKLRISNIDKVKKYLNENSVSADEYKDKVEHYNATLAKSIMPRIQKLSEKENISLESIATESEKLEFLLNKDMELEGLIMNKFNKEVEALESLLEKNNTSIEDILKTILTQSLESFENEAFKLDPSFELTEEGFECYGIEIKNKEKFQTIVNDKSINTVMESVARNLDSLVNKLPVEDGKEWLLTFTKGGIEDLSIRLKLVDLEKTDISFESTMEEIATEGIIKDIAGMIHRAWSRFRKGNISKEKNNPIDVPKEEFNKDVETIKTVIKSNLNAWVDEFLKSNDKFKMMIDKDIILISPNMDGVSNKDGIVLSPIAAFDAQSCYLDQKDPNKLVMGNQTYDKSDLGADAFTYISNAMGAFKKAYDNTIGKELNKHSELNKYGLSFEILTYKPGLLNMSLNKNSIIFGITSRPVNEK